MAKHDHSNGWALGFKRIFPAVATAGVVQIDSLLCYNMAAFYFLKGVYLKMVGLKEKEAEKRA